jgi:DNA polymerase V
MLVTNKMVGLLDCNNFYCSCERVFNPRLQGKPMVVLSNNDGCVISRSNEAKALGVKMGAAMFEIKDMVKKHDIKTLSSNYVLYGDMSSRVVAVLQSIVAEVEVYSIDEMFFDLAGFSELQIELLGREVVKKVYQCTGIPVSVGVSYSKALAKIANKTAKKRLEMKGYVSARCHHVADTLSVFPIEDVWGVGRKYARMLQGFNIDTAWDFALASKHWIQERMTVMGARLWEELNGQQAMEWELEAPAKKNICTSRSFGQLLLDLASIESALSMYVARCAEKLRKQGSCAGVITVFLHTNGFRKDLDQYSNAATIPLSVATSSTLELVHHARAALRSIYLKGYAYKKVGVIVSDIVPNNAVQQSLFDTTDRRKQTTIMDVVDKLNAKYGRDMVRVALQGFNDATWKMKQGQLSPCYTTRWGDILTVKS